MQHNLNVFNQFYNIDYSDDNSGKQYLSNIYIVINFLTFFFYICIISINPEKNAYIKNVKIKNKSNINIFIIFINSNISYFKT